MRKLRELSRSLYNLWYYFRVVWKDRDWDFQYIESLQLAKFKKIYKFRTTSSWFMPYEDADKGNQAIRLMISILERRQSGWYTDVWVEHYGQFVSYSFIEVPDKPGNKQMKTHCDVKANSNYGVGGFSDKIEERDWKIYCQLLEKYQRRFWD